MRLPKSIRSKGRLARLKQLRSSFHERRPLPASRERRGLHVLIAIAAVGGLITSGALGMAEDPRSLDVQLSSAMREAGTTLAAWEQQLSHGLQVSLRAVADGREAPAATQPVAVAMPAMLKPAVLQTAPQAVH
ncbi:hypothetical protein [Roseateles sp. P5_E7]